MFILTNTQSKKPLRPSSCFVYVSHLHIDVKTQTQITPNSMIYSFRPKNSLLSSTPLNQPFLSFTSQTSISSPLYTPKNPFPSKHIGFPLFWFLRSKKCAVSVVGVKEGKHFLSEKKNFCRLRREMDMFRWFIYSLG